MEERLTSSIWHFGFANQIIQYVCLMLSGHKVLVDASGATSVLWRLSLTLSPGPHGNLASRAIRSAEAVPGKACSCVEAGLK